MYEKALNRLPLLRFIWTKLYFHTEENRFSYGRKSIFIRRKQAKMWLGGVLFLKKVHSWGGVTEMVLGLFLLVL